MTKEDKNNSIIDKETGEILEKAYQTQAHGRIVKLVSNQYNYVHKTLRDPENPENFSRLGGDILSMLIMELAAMYESLGRWLADEKLHLADMKTARNFKFADLYLQYKHRKSETNETARMQAVMLCHQDDLDINEAQHNYDRVETWKKAVNKYYEAARSQLSYEKFIGNMS